MYVDGDLRYALEIPNALSLLAFWDPEATVIGLDAVPPALQPPVTPVHLSFQLMVGIGFGLLALDAWFALAWWRRRDLPRSPRFLRFAALSGVAAVLALEAGWVVTEVGRQPWVVYGILPTAEAVNPAPGAAVRPLRGARRLHAADRRHGVRAAPTRPHPDSRGSAGGRRRLVQGGVRR